MATQEKLFATKQLFCSTTLSLWKSAIKKKNTSQAILKTTFLVQ